jgi:hypothetical protein
VQADNSLAPNSVSVDSTEAAWFQPIVASAGTRIVLSGRFPDARYASFSVYTPSGGFAASHGVGTSLDDYWIAPQPGSLNPWQQQAAPGGRFTVTIRPDASPGQANTLPLPPGTTSQYPGYLVYRVYLPAEGSFSDVPLPVLTVEQGRAARTLPMAIRASHELANARLLTIDGSGHTSPGESTCATQDVTTYLTTGQLPPRGTVCQPDTQPFH